MVVEVIFQTYQLDIFQGSKINDFWETGRSPIKQNIFDSFWQKRISVFQEFLPSSLPPKCENFFRHVISYSLYIILCLMLLILKS